VTTSPIFTARETHGRVLRPTNRIVAHSQDAGWRSLHAAIFEEFPLEVLEPPIRHPSLIYHLSRPTEVSRKIEGNALESALIGPRRMCLTPGEATTRWRHNGHPEILQVYLRQTTYEAAVAELYNCDPATAEIDRLDDVAMARMLVEAHRVAVDAALAAAADIARATALVVEAIEGGGRIVLVGAGTSGRWRRCIRMFRQGNRSCARLSCWCTMVSWKRPRNARTPSLSSTRMTAMPCSCLAI